MKGITHAIDLKDTPEVDGETVIFGADVSLSHRSLPHCAPKLTASHAFRFAGYPLARPRFC